MLPPLDFGAQEIYHIRKLQEAIATCAYSKRDEGEQYLVIFFTESRVRLATI